MDVQQHLVTRYLNLSLYPNAAISVDTATFPLFSFDHRMVGFQRYRPDGIKSLRRDPKQGRYYTICSEPAVWGLESLELFDTDLVVVCESIFKACRFHNYGIPAIATLTNNPKPLKQQILNLKPTVVAVPDPDEPGQELINYGTHFVAPDKPIDDMSAYEFDEFIYLHFYKE